MKKLSILLAAVLCLMAAPARADLKIDVTRGQVNPMPIAIPDFVTKDGADSGMGRNMTDVNSSDLKRSGLVRPLYAKSFIKDSEAAAKDPNFGQ